MYIYIYIYCTCRYSVLMALISNDPKKNAKTTCEEWITERYENAPECSSYDVDHCAGALFFLRSFESMSKAKKMECGDIMRQQLPGHLQREYEWKGKTLATMTQSGADNKQKSIGEALSNQNYYPSTFNNKELSREGMFFLLGKFIFVFATTGKPVSKDEAVTFTKDAIGLSAQHLQLHMVVLRVMQDPAVVSPALWKVRALLYVGRWSEAEKAAVVACKDKEWKLAGIHGHGDECTFAPDKLDASQAMLGLSAGAGNALSSSSSSSSSTTSGGAAGGRASTSCLGWRYRWRGVQ